MGKPVFQSGTNTILLAWLVAGTLDILCAIFFLANGNAAAVFKFIARGALGDAASQGGTGMIVVGAIFHYTIALCFTVGYFLAFPYIPLFKKQKIMSGLLYGIFVWAFMQYVVLPFTHNPPGPASLSGVWKGIVILMIAIGLPISLIIPKHYAMKES